MNEFKSRVEASEKIKRMTLNTKSDIVLELEQYGLTPTFCNNLYALIEKEKYLLKRFNVEPTIYPHLSEQTKRALENEFITRNESCAYSLESYGYIEVLDPKYEEYFDKHKYLLLHLCIFQNNLHKVI